MLVHYTAFKTTGVTTNLNILTILDNYKLYLKYIQIILTVLVHRK